MLWLIHRKRRNSGRVQTCSRCPPDRVAHREPVTRGAGTVACARVRQREGAVGGGMVPDAEQRPHRRLRSALGSRGLEHRRPIMGDTRQRADGLLDAPRVQTVPAPQVDEAIHARGNVNVRARALIARGKGLSHNAPLDGSILGGHDLSWGSTSWHLAAELSIRAAGARRLARSRLACARSVRMRVRRLVCSTDLRSAADWRCVWRYA